MLAVDVLESMTQLSGTARAVLAPTADWQIFRRQRPMYGQVYDWHTLEGPFVCRRQGRYVLFYSGGNWEQPTYGVSWAVADSPLGPWRETTSEPLLRTVPGKVVGPGHNSVVVGPDGQDVMVYHAWDPEGTARRMFVDPLRWTPAGPELDGPTWETTDLARVPPAPTG
jgi:GH43 family beta-xylosidase